jgi:hypothetical protein
MQSTSAYQTISSATRRGTIIDAGEYRARLAQRLVVGHVGGDATKVLLDPEVGDRRRKRREVVVPAEPA